MSIKPTLFVVTDIETTIKHRIAFDVAWKVIDRKGKEYGRGSYVVTDAFKMDVPYFKEKLGYYFDDTYEHLITPKCFNSVRTIFNQQIQELKALGHNVIFCAYNAGFDAKYLGVTSEKLLGKKFLYELMPMLDIWHFWADSCPLNYTAKLTTSKKFYSTTAEDVFRFEMQVADFIERHIAWHDVEAEADILLKVLDRKKKMPIVLNPKNFTGGIYRLANNRLGITGNIALAA